MNIEPNEPDRWKKNSTRAAILEAARRLAAREGPEAVSLGRVAAEAGFATAVVYAYFVSKDDLISAVVGDDLEVLAEAPHAEAGDLALPSDAVTPPAIDLSPEGETPAPAEEPAPAPEETPAPDVVEKPSTAAVRRAQLKQESWTRNINARLHRDVEPPGALSLSMLETEADLVAAIAQLEQAVAQLQSRPVNAWMERRLSAFEHTLVDLEARMAACERDCAALIEAVQGTENAQGIAQAIGNLQAQEERQRAALADFRLYMKDMAGRLSAAEASLATGPDHDGEPKPAGKRKAAAASGRVAGVPRLVLWAVPVALLVILVLIGIYLATMRPLAPNLAKPAASAVAQSAAPPSADARVAALAKAGNPLAQTVAGLKLLNGDGTATDIPSAVFWLGRAAAQHQPVAQYWLGTLFEHGQGVPLDKAKAMYWYGEAANLGNAKAMYRLGVGDAQGWGGKADDQAAAKWFEMAAQLGVVDAQFNLAVLYEKGAGVAQDLSKAFTWYTIAADQGDAEAKSRVEALSKQLSATDVAAARAAAAKFQPQTPAAAANDAPTVAAVARLP